MATEYYGNINEDSFTVSVTGGKPFLNHIRCYDSYSEAVIAYNDIKAKGDFDTLTFTLVRTLEKVVKNGNDN